MEVEESIPIGDNTLNIDRVSTKFLVSSLSTKSPLLLPQDNKFLPFAQTWIPPLGLSFKINVDVAVGLCFSFIAVVARDQKGELVFTSTMKMNTTIPLQAEAKAIKWALSLAPAMGKECIIVESDC